MPEDFILTLQLEDTSLCDDLVDYYNSNSEYKQPGVSNGGDKTSTDVIVYPNSSDPIIVSYFNFLKFCMGQYQEKYEYFKCALAFKEPFNIQHYAPGEGFLNWHSERGMNQSHQRALVFMTYLNDVDDGGQTQFLYQEKEVQPKKGLTVLWPTDFTHTHRGVTSPTQTKMIATGWYNYLDVQASLEYLKINCDLDLEL